MTLAAVSIALSLAVLVIGRKRRARRSEAWEGVVAEKTRSSPDGQNIYHSVQITLDDGRARTVGIRGNLWKTLSVGDTLRKLPGEYHPTRV